MTTYPLSPGYKVAGPSQESANVEAGIVDTMREAALLCLRTFGPQTADECAEELGKSVLTIRPRFSELLRLGLIEDTGLRRPNASGHRATVWRIKAQQPKQADLL